MTNPTQPTQQPAGWYPDPNGDTRYWDGAAWTVHTTAGLPGTEQAEPAVTQVLPPVAPEPVAPVPAPRRAPKKQRPGWLIPAGVGVGALIVGLIIGGTALGNSSTKPAAAPVTVHSTATVSVTPPPVRTTVTTTPTKVVATHQVTHVVTFTPVPVVAFTDGTLLVGTDVQPGIYHTVGGSNCYWARLSSLNTTDIIDNNNITGPTSIQILPTDKAIETNGGCAWTKVG